MSAACSASISRRARCVTSSEAHPHTTQQKAVTSQPWVIDTNIVLDLWLFEDPATIPLRAALQSGAISHLATASMRDELERVLAYPHLVKRMAKSNIQAQDILSRFGELGVYVTEGMLYFNPNLLRKDEFLIQPETFEYVDVTGQIKYIELVKDSLCFTVCQVPIVFNLGDDSRLELITKNDSIRVDSLLLDQANSQQIFDRTDRVQSNEPSKHH